MPFNSLVMDSIEIQQVQMAKDSQLWQDLENSMKGLLKSLLPGLDEHARDVLADIYEPPNWPHIAANQTNGVSTNADIFYYVRAIVGNTARLSDGPMHAKNGAHPVDSQMLARAVAACLDDWIRDTGSPPGYMVARLEQESAQWMHHQQAFPAAAAVLRAVTQWYTQHRSKACLLYCPPVDQPGYTSIISDPLFLGDVFAKLYTAGYSSPQAVLDDVRRVFSNARFYYNSMVEEGEVPAQPEAEADGQVAQVQVGQYAAELVSSFEDFWTDHVHEFAKAAPADANQFSAGFAPGAASHSSSSLQTIVGVPHGPHAPAAHAGAGQGTGNVGNQVAQQQVLAVQGAELHDNEVIDLTGDEDVPPSAPVPATLSSPPVALLSPLNVARPPLASLAPLAPLAQQPSQGAQAVGHHNNTGKATGVVDGTRAEAGPGPVPIPPSASPSMQRPVSTLPPAALGPKLHVPSPVPQGQRAGGMPPVGAASKLVVHKDATAAGKDGRPGAHPPITPKFLHDKRQQAAERRVIGADEVPGKQGRGKTGAGLQPVVTAASKLQKSMHAQSSKSSGGGAPRNMALTAGAGKARGDDYVMDGTTTTVSGTQGRAAGPVTGEKPPIPRKPSSPPNVGAAVPFSCADMQKQSHAFRETLSAHAPTPWPTFTVGGAQGKGSTGMGGTGAGSSPGSKIRAGAGTTAQGVSSRPAMPQAMTAGKRSDPSTPAIATDVAGTVPNTHGAADTGAAQSVGTAVTIPSEARPLPSPSAPGPANQPAAATSGPSACPADGSDELNSYDVGEFLHFDENLQAGPYQDPQNDTSMYDGDAHTAQDGPLSVLAVQEQQQQQQQGAVTVGGALAPGMTCATVQGEEGSRGEPMGAGAGSTSPSTALETPVQPEGQSFPHGVYSFSPLVPPFTLPKDTRGHAQDEGKEEVQEDDRGNEKPASGSGLRTYKLGKRLREDDVLEYAPQPVQRMLAVAGLEVEAEADAEGVEGNDGFVWEDEELSSHLQLMPEQEHTGLFAQFVDSRTTVLAPQVGVDMPGREYPGSQGWGMGGQGSVQRAQQGQLEASPADASAGGAGWPHHESAYLPQPALKRARVSPGPLGSCWCAGTGEICPSCSQDM